MRRFLSIAAIALLAAGCNQAPSADAKKADSTMAKTDSISYPYKAGYSSAFTIGDAANVKTLLNIYKAYDDNKLEDSRSLWGDTVTMQFAEGFTFHGSIDSLMAGGKADRAQFSSVVDSIDAWVPLHSTDRNEDWVAIWTREYTTSIKGKKDTSDVHEVWQFKNGKAVFVIQYKGKHKDK